MQLGQKLRHIRSGRKMTLEQLSHASGVSVGQLSQIERDLSSPTVTKIQQIVKALEINITDLFEDHPAQTDARTVAIPLPEPRKITVVRAPNRKKFFWPFGASLELLAPVHDRKIEFIYIRYPVGSQVEDPYTHNGEECGLVLEGKFRGIIGDEEVVLEAGDSIYFDSNIPHQWENVGDTEVRAIWAITPPSI